MRAQLVGVCFFDSLELGIYQQLLVTHQMAGGRAGNQQHNCPNQADCVISCCQVGSLQMIPKNTSKFIISLHQKKYRQRNQAFLVEGAKSVSELLKSDFEVQLLLATPDFLQQNSGLLPKGLAIEEVGESEL